MNKGSSSLPIVFMLFIFFTLYNMSWCVICCPFHKHTLSEGWYPNWNSAPIDGEWFCSVCCPMSRHISHPARVLHLLSELPPVELGIAVSGAHSHFPNGGYETKDKTVSLGVSLLPTPSHVCHIKVQRKHTDDGEKLLIIIAASAKNPLEMAFFVILTGFEVQRSNLRV